MGNLKFVPHSITYEKLLLRIGRVFHINKNNSQKPQDLKSNDITYLWGIIIIQKESNSGSELVEQTIIVNLSLTLILSNKILIIFNHQQQQHQLKPKHCIHYRNIWTRNTFLKLLAPFFPRKTIIRQHKYFNYFTYLHIYKSWLLSFTLQLKLKLIFHYYKMYQSFHIKSFFIKTKNL